MFGRPVPTSLVTLIVVLALINGVAIMFSLYWRIFWLDMLTHFLGGLWIGGMYLWWRGHAVYRTQGPAHATRIFISTLVVVLCAGLLWEGFEYIADVLYEPVWYDVNDAASDVAFDVLGGLFAALFGIARYSTRNTSISHT